jgi:hypothetical protein
VLVQIDRIRWRERRRGDGGDGGLVVLLLRYEKRLQIFGEGTFFEMEIEIYT